MKPPARTVAIWLLLIASAASCRRPAVTAVAPRTDAAAPATRPATRPAPEPAPGLDEWVGVYCSPKEIRGFSGTVLVVEKDYTGEHLRFDMRFTSDFSSADSIRQPEQSGSCVAERHRLFVPRAYGYYHDGKPVIASSLTRYTRMVVNGHVVLMRDDALEAFTRKDKLYDYGILIRTGRELARRQALREVPAPSIKLLYRDPAKPWNDPFVAGPNER